MAYLPGTDEAIYPGSDRIEARRVVEDDRHLTILDLTPIAYPLDGLIATLARAISDVGLMQQFVALGNNRRSSSITCDAIDALSAEPSIARVLQITLPPENAEHLGTELRTVADPPPDCYRRGCERWADAGSEFCAGCGDAAAEAWSGRRGA